MVYGIMMVLILGEIDISIASILTLSQHAAVVFEAGTTDSCCVYRSYSRSSLWCLNGFLGKVRS